ncbi:ABC transporter permease [Herbiconiux ginsengi]|uniref:Putative ABC transport system permease protein n=1 Tax=Herbiconiux ginsengi TaxID=381665 RepID=A0A1H3N917_9MICO|nr:ABC transporter permease [Herbiconiux ginsengi]SDY85233.1 putative ABC transport system permease protein [Herbiconiux ginsengi]
MNGFDLIRSAIGNSLRSKTRTVLTVIAIFIGAFTLTLTSGVGTGINDYIDSTLSSIGASDVMSVTKTPADAQNDGPVEYDPDSSTVESDRPAGGDIEAITSTDLDTLAAVPGVLSVEPAVSVRADFVQYDGGTRYQSAIGELVPGMSLELAAGEQPDASASDDQIAIPQSFVEPLGFADDADAIGKTLTIGITDAQGTQSTIDATIVGVSEPGLVGGTSAAPNTALLDALHQTQSVGLTEKAAQTYASATVRFDPDATDAQIATLKADLKAAGYDGVTVEDQIGSFKTVIDAIILVLNGFAVIALLAAGFGIVNTLLMSVQERTREIGLMKAMGMSGGRVFGLFTIEAVFIGFLGSAIGVVIGMLAGTLANSVLSGGLLSALPGLSLVAFDPVSLGVIVLTVMGIAFLAGTIPALRAARQDPITSLRYE